MKTMEVRISIPLFTKVGNFPSPKRMSSFPSRKVHLHGAEIEDCHNICQKHVAKEVLRIWIFRITSSLPPRGANAWLFLKY